MPKKPVPPLEKHIRQGIVRQLRVFGCHVYSFEHGNRHPRHAGQRITPGIPDLLVFDTKRGKWTFAEIKRPYGYLSQHQKVFRNLAAELNIPWQLWRSAEDAVVWWNTKEES